MDSGTKDWLYLKHSDDAGQTTDDRFEDGY